jgi:hypothetical protein
MAKYGLFTGAKPVPDKTWEGDYMKHEKDHVTILKRAINSNMLDDIVAAIRLEKGQDVRKL